MKRYFLYSALCFTILLFLNSCTWENEEEYFDVEQCDTTNLTYNDVESIFRINCAVCHYPEATPVEEIILDNYENIVSAINTGRVLPAINHEGPVDMPRGQPKLPECTINQIEAWVNNGMPEN